jgi:hypothetical protein
MPKRWIVTYSQTVFAAINGPDEGQFASLATRSPNRVVVADELTVDGGALVFTVDGEATLVFGPEAYWQVELQDDTPQAAGDKPYPDSP